MSPYDRKRKRVLKRLFVALSLFISSFTILFLANFLLQNSFPNLADWNPLVWVCLTSAVAAVGYQPIDQAYTWLFRQVLFPRRSRVLHILQRLSEELALTTDLRELANLLVNTLGEVLHLKTVSLLVRAPREEGYVIISAYGWSVTEYRKLRLQAGNPVLELMKTAGPQVLLLERAVRSLTWQEANTLTSQFETLRATCAIPLWVKTELVGSINLLTYASDEAPDEGDLRFFRDFGAQVALGVRNALLIQELKMLGDELRDKQSELLQTAKLTAIEQLATGIAHEIHNPLTIISGKAQVLLLQKDRKVYDEKVEEVLKVIVKQTRRAADITKKLLMFSRASASPREKLRLEGVLEDTISLIAYQTSLEGIEIQRFIGQDLPDFTGNVQELREVFFNLILNALQVIGPGGKIQVGMTYQKADKVFVIQLADTGPGIPAENLDKVFNPFFTTRPEGIGLGLFVTQQIVHRYGGSIRVESQPGEGTLFVIELPLEAPPIPNPSSSPNARTGGKETHGATIAGG
jgi:signal transduction histidine kinase